MISQFLLLFTLSWLVYSGVSLAINIRRARAMNVPWVMVPISPMNIPWIVAEPLVFRILDTLPFRLGNFSRYGRRGWHFQEKAASHVELGDAWTLVTPRETFLHICNPDAINDIFARRLDFVRPVQLYSKWSSNLGRQAIINMEQQKCLMFLARMCQQYVSKRLPQTKLIRSLGWVGRLATSEKDCLCTFQRKHQQACLVGVLESGCGYDSCLDFPW